MNDDYLCDRGLKVNSNSVEESWKFATRYFCAEELSRGKQRFKLFKFEV